MPKFYLDPDALRESPLLHDAKEIMRLVRENNEHVLVFHDPALMIDVVCCGNKPIDHPLLGLIWKEVETQE